MTGDAITASVTDVPAPFGIEEEFMLLDPKTLRPLSRAPGLMAQWNAQGESDHSLKREFLQSQLEYNSPILTHAKQAREALTSLRTQLAQQARESGSIVGSTGTPFHLQRTPSTSEDQRNQEIEALMGPLAPEHQINGMHIHVEIPHPDAGVGALNLVRLWLPTIVALAANSPFWQGRDSGFASWRTIQSLRLTTTACPPPFDDGDDYERRTAALNGLGIGRDAGTLQWLARLCAHQPTLEIRAPDAQLSVSNAVFIALVCRALVRTGVKGPVLGPAPEPELVHAALWHAAKYGLGATLWHPDCWSRKGETTETNLRPAKDVVEALLSLCEPEFVALGDRELVWECWGDLQVRGTGADRQCAAWEASGVPGLRRLMDSALVE